MSHLDHINYFALRFIDARAREDYDAYRAIERELNASEYTASHVAQALVSFLVPLLERSPSFREDLDRMLEQTRLFAQAEIPDDIDVFDDGQDRSDGV